MMTSRTLISIAFRSLKNHAFRSFLASLGVVLGVGAVIGMMSISEGAKKMALEQIKSRGIKNIIIDSVEDETAENKKGGGATRYKQYGLTEKDLLHIREFDNIDKTVVVRKVHGPVFYNGDKTTIGTWGIAGDFLSMTGSQLSDSRSRYFCDTDEHNLTQVCLLGTTAARTIFGVADPLGQYVECGGNNFKVIALIHIDTETELVKGSSINNQVFVPLHAAKNIFSEYTVKDFRATKVEIQKLYIEVKFVDQLKNTAARLRTYLQHAHENKDYYIQIPYELLNQQKATQRIFSIVMGSIAAISLLIGGIGIMNIMLANIYERTREIGTRRALGARKKDIVIQFLAESVIMTVLGGLAGIAIGYFIAFAVKEYAGMETIVSPNSVILSFLVSVGTGIIFGTYPAVKAANLNPITALRRE
ncbi:MAG: ABC transporter permease [Lentisphaeraceae bacterium]|nr:ABC transporter permease [Lentisphaeraceae bacterium]